MQAETSKLRGFNSPAITITFLPSEIYMSVADNLRSVYAQREELERVKLR